MSELSRPTLSFRLFGGGISDAFARSARAERNIQAHCRDGPGFQESSADFTGSNTHVHRRRTQLAHGSVQQRISPTGRAGSARYLAWHSTEFFLPGPGQASETLLQEYSTYHPVSTTRPSADSSAALASVLALAVSLSQSAGVGTHGGVLSYDLAGTRYNG